MGSRKHNYEGEDIDVHYELKRCIHAAECVHDLPRVFDPNQKPWVDPEAADADLIAAVVECCPSGALHHDRKDGGDAEIPDDRNTIRIQTDGPIYVRGDIVIRDTAGDTIVEDTRVALCRCGGSANMPFCDLSHQKNSFMDSGRLGEGLVKTESTLTEGDQLEVKPAHNGPLILRGKFFLIGAEGEERAGEVVALCRCGQSANKPFCDGSHKSVGFSG
jgi:CDGSH-type Zn-finger protein/uncharacterized Fe-S cluster protein YjdI